MLRAPLRSRSQKAEQPPKAVPAPYDHVNAVPGAFRRQSGTGSENPQQMRGLLTRQLSTRQSKKLSPNVAALRNAVDNLLQEGTSSPNSFAFLRAFQGVTRVLDSHDYNFDEGWEGGLFEACVPAMDNPMLADLAWSLAKGFSHRFGSEMYVVPTFADKMAREIVAAKNIDAVWVARSLANIKELVEPIANLPGVAHQLVQNILDNPKSELAVASLHTLFNLTNYQEGHQSLLAEEKIIDALLIMTEEDSERSLVSTMALANLVGKDEVKSELLRNVRGAPLLNIVAVLEAHTKTPEATAAAFDAIWFLFEPLQPLRWLSIPPQNRAVLGPRLFPLLGGALNKSLKLDDAASGKCTVKILAHYAFDNEYLVKLKEDKAIIQMLEDIMHKKKDDEAWQTCAYDAQGLLWTLKGGDQLEVSADAVKANQVMISYNWSHKALAIRVHTYFATRGYKVWRDDDKISEVFMESMAQAVLESAAVVILVSPQYKESANCQREAMFASKRNKKIIPLLAVEGYSGDGWLELLIAPLMQYDLTKNFDNVMRTVYERELKPYGNNSPRSNGAGTQAQKPAFSSQKRALSAGTIAQTLRECPGLDSKVAEAFERERIDGNALETLLAAWNAGHIRFNEVREWFNVGSIGELMNLKRALDELFESHHTN